MSDETLLIITGCAAQWGLQVTVKWQTHVHTHRHTGVFSYSSAHKRMFTYTHTHAHTQTRPCSEGTQCSVDPGFWGRRRNIGSNYGDMSINMPVRNSTAPRPQATLLWLCSFNCVCVSVCSLSTYIVRLQVIVEVLNAAVCWIISSYLVLYVIWYIMANISNLDSNILTVFIVTDYTNR